jgi:KDO2-lipid IV(A) lauroyltransferase
MISAPSEQIIKRMHLLNPEILLPYFQKGRHIAFVFGHYGNWDFTAAISTKIKHIYTAIYAPLKNKFVDQLVKDIRGRFGTVLLPKQEVSDYMKKKNRDPMLLLFMADQSPRWNSKLYWTTFLNQETAVATGAERYARLFDMPVVFGHIRKVSRGYYEMELEVLTDKPAEEPEGRISELHVKALERDILDEPAYWLWSHRRWKKKVEKSKSLKGKASG